MKQHVIARLSASFGVHTCIRGELVIDQSPYQ